MKHLYTILTGIIVISLIACSKNGPKGAGVNSPAASGVNSGTIDGGGGNTFNDKMLESYIVKPEDLSGYELLTPLLKALKNALNYVDPNADVYLDPINYSIFEYVLGKTWYLIPANLTTITNDKIGTPFDAGTVQVAFQTMDAIWIDENAFNKMPLEEKGKLILHEIVMGLKMLKFESDANLYSAIDPFADQSESETIVNPKRLELNISSADVSQVRTVTRKLWERKDAVNEKTEMFKDGFSRYEFGQLMVKYDFDRTIYKNTEGQVGLFQLIAGYKVKDIDKLFSDITDDSPGLNADYLNKEGAKNTREAHSRCRISIKKVNDKKASVTIAIDPYNYSSNEEKYFKERKTTFTVNVPETLHYQYGMRWFDHLNHPGQMIQLYGEGKTKESVKRLELNFSGNSLIGVDVRELAITAIHDNDDYTIRKGSSFGDYFQCYQETEITDNDLEKN